jgi:heme/copper-type cytochrome/quinol oxidase subunit 1
MPPITRWHVKLALVYLVAALALGIAQAAGPETWAALFAVYVHLLVVGWITQMIFGVAYWMFPKFSKERPRGSNRLAVAAFVLLNLGLVIRAVAEPLQFRDPAASLGWLLAVSAAAQWLAGMAFIANMWPRVKER